MSVPRLSRAMTLEVRTRLPDGAGGFAETWVAQGVLWGAVTPGAGREVAGPGAMLSSVTCRVTVRGAPVGAPSRPEAGQRLVMDGRVLEILAVTERDPDGRYLTCFAKEERPA